MINFNIPYVPEISKQYVLEALQANHQEGDGPFTKIASKRLSDLVGGGHVLLTPSCTHALEMASMLTNIGPGDEVILPSYTFTSAATAITKFGATPVFVDIEPDTKGINVNQVREAITPRTKAISWVNYAGVAPDIDSLQNLAKDFDLLLIEDNAHGLGGTYKGKPLGGFGDFATQSFHSSKNIQCGEGGALVINNPTFIERAEMIREKGTDRHKFVQGVVQKYQWVDQGSSYLLADVLAALLLGQLESFQEIQDKRKKIFDFYAVQLSDWATEFGIELPFIPSGEINTAHMFYLVAKSRQQRDEIIQKLSSFDIRAVFHYQSLASSAFGSKYPAVRETLEFSQKISDQLFRLPLFYKLGIESQKEVLQRITA
jgi:dTDP-4-amino-4,6-dideoxygalactose transaminase